MYEIDANFIQFPNGKREKFKSFIAESIEFDDVLIVRLEAEPVHPTNENVYSYDFKGRLLWQIPVRPHVFPQCPYVSIFRKGAFVEGYNWDGYVMTLHPKTGLVVAEGPMICASSRQRPASRRVWI